MFNSNSSLIEPEWKDAMNYGSLTCSIVGIVSNMITIFILSRINLKMIRTDKMIMILSINNLLFLISSIVKQYVIRHMETDRTTICISMSCEESLFMACSISIVILLSNRIYVTERNIDEFLLCILYTIVLVSFVLQTILCLASVSNKIFDIMTQFIFFFSFGVLIRNEVTYCWKCYKKEVSYSNIPVRLNIARIFIYNMLISLFLFVFLDSSPIMVIIRFTTFFTSLYIMVYLICSHKNFRTCLLNSLKCRSNRIDNDPPVQSTNDDDDDEDNPTVNICCFM